MSEEPRPPGAERGAAEHPWPPSKEDLERLYLRDRLSAAKIAKRYRLDERYASPKTAESTVLYHLKRLGIARRDPAEHVRKVTDAMVDEWVRGYRDGESLKQIAREVSPVTVFNHLRKRGLQLRERVEAQIAVVRRFHKTPFDGDDHEMGYWLGLVRGDLDVRQHGRAIRVRTASSHPAMIDLVSSLLAPHGPVRIRPRYSKFSGYEWSVEGELDSSYDFLLHKRRDAPDPELVSESVLGYLAGLFDAEGSLWLRKDRFFAPRLSLTNGDSELLSWVKSVLVKLSFHPYINPPSSNGIRQVHLWRVDEVIGLLRLLRLRHPEKKAKVKLLLDESARDDCQKMWSSLMQQFEADKMDFLSLPKPWLQRDVREVPKAARCCTSVLISINLWTQY